MRQAAGLAQPVVTISVDCDEESEEDSNEIMGDNPCNCSWTIFTDAGLGTNSITFNLEEEVSFTSLKMTLGPEFT